MNMSKKVLIVSYDLAFSEAILGPFKDLQDIRFLLAGNLSDGLAILTEGNVDLLIIDYAIVLDSALSNFLSSPSIGKMPIVLVAQEKKFLDGFNEPNMSKFSRNELDSRVIPFIRNILV